MAVYDTELFARRTPSLLTYFTIRYSNFSTQRKMADQTLIPEVFELNNGSMQVKITNYGATITSLSVPDKHGM